MKIARKRAFIARSLWQACLSRERAALRFGYSVNITFHESSTYSGADQNSSWSEVDLSPESATRIGERQGGGGQ